MHSESTPAITKNILLPAAAATAGASSCLPSVMHATTKNILLPNVAVAVAAASSCLPSVATATTKNIHLAATAAGAGAGASSCLPSVIVARHGCTTAATATTPAVVDVKKKVITKTALWSKVERDVQENPDVHANALRALLYKRNVGGGGSGGSGGDGDTAAVRLLLQNLQQKISSYRHQDVLKDKWNEEMFVDIDTILQLMAKCDLRCHYCELPVKLLYENVRDGRQWTLDRIDNTAGHNRGNLYLSCLTCNLRRRCLYPEKYVFTRRLKLVKLP